MRQMATAYDDGGASGQQQPRVQDMLAAAVAWLGHMCVSHVVAVQRLHGEARPSGAELRMQLSAAATLLKYLNAEASRPFTLLILLSLSEEPWDAAAALLDSHQLHFISLYIAGLQNQPAAGVSSWGLSSASPGSTPLDPLSFFTVGARSLAFNILTLHGNLLDQLFHLACAVGLGSLALTVMTTGPVWESFAAAAHVSLHPYDRLRSSREFDAEGYHMGTSNAISFIAHASYIARRLVEAAFGEETYNDNRPLQEQRSSILACVTAAHALLHSEALGCLIGQLWHIRARPGVSGRRGSSQQPSGSGEGDYSDFSNDEEGYTVGHLVLGVFSDLHSVMECAFDLASRSCPHIVEADDSAAGSSAGSSSEMAMGHRLQEFSLVGLEVEVEGSTPPSFFDVPTRAQAGVREEGLSSLSQIRSLVTELLAMLNSNSSPAASPGFLGNGWSRWEVLQAALFRSLPPEQQEEWGRPLWCCNPGCTNMSGPSELQLKTYACGGGCGVRYCSRECQVQGWRLGHRHSCVEMQGR